MILYGTLLWIDESNHSSINNKNNKIVSYFRQIDVLAKTLKFHHGVKLIVFTNDVLRLYEWFKERNEIRPFLIEIKASYVVPDKTPFFGAHYKLEALAAARNLLESYNDRFLLLDSDVIVVRPFNEVQMNAIYESDLLTYDITEQVNSVYGYDKIRKDLELVANETFENHNWYGGEFLCGGITGFDLLLKEAREMLPRYFENINSIHHIGDEMFISAALNKISLMSSEIILSKQKSERLITRHWSRFSNPSIDWHLKHSLIHCPGSKPLIEVLSKFKVPSVYPVGYFLKIYSVFVRFYQLLKNLLIKSNK